MKAAIPRIHRAAMRIVPRLLSLQLMLPGILAQAAELESSANSAKEEEAAEQADLVKKTLNPVADLISACFDRRKAPPTGAGEPCLVLRGLGKSKRERDLLATIFRVQHRDRYFVLWDSASQ